MRIGVCTNSCWWQQALDNYYDRGLGEGKGDPAAKKLCAATDVAALVLHELVHGCAVSLGLDMVKDYEDCAITFRTGSLWRWAMAQRYGSLENSYCCEHWFNPELFPLACSAAPFAIDTDRAFYGMDAEEAMLIPDRAKGPDPATN